MFKVTYWLFGEKKTSEFSTRKAALDFVCAREAIGYITTISVHSPDGIELNADEMMDYEQNEWNKAIY